MRNILFFRLAIASILALSILLAGYIVILVSPPDRWFKYQKIANVDAGKDIFMTSTYEKGITDPLTYNDVLFCDFGNGLIRFSSNMSKSLARSSTLKTATWRYEGQTPNKEGMCEIESQIEVVVPFSIIKSQTIRSSPFKYSPLK